MQITQATVVASIVHTSASLQTVTTEATVLLAVTDRAAIVYTTKPTILASLLHGLLVRSVDRLVICWHGLLDLGSRRRSQEAAEESKSEKGEYDFEGRHGGL